MKVVIAVVVLGGLLVGEALSNRIVERVRELEREFRIVFSKINVEAIADGLLRFAEQIRAATLSADQVAAAFAGWLPADGRIVEGDPPWFIEIDSNATTIDSYVGRGEELEALEEVLEEQRERIRRIVP